MNLDLNFLQRSEQINPDPWGTSQPHNAYEELPDNVAKLLIGHETRLESGQITEQSSFHQSVAVAPSKLDNPKYMVTLETLKSGFSHGWAPTYADYNSFELECKEKWGKPQVSIRYLPFAHIIFGIVHQHSISISCLLSTPSPSLMLQMLTYFCRTICRLPMKTFRICSVSWSKRNDRNVSLSTSGYPTNYEYNDAPFIYFDGI